MANIASQDFREKLPQLLKMVEEYVQNTYGAHYAADGGSVQVIDLWENIGIAQAAFQADLIKYSSRYGKKESKNPKDLQKILHYALLLYYFDHVRANVSESDKSARK